MKDLSKSSSSSSVTLSCSAISKKRGGEKGSYIGMTKRKIKERIKERQNDIKQGKYNTALEQFYKKRNN